MENPTIFSLSVIFRVLLAMLMPIQIVSSIGVTFTSLTGYGMIWLVSEGNIQLLSNSVFKSIIYSIPAVVFSIYFKHIEKKSYPKKSAFLASILIFVIPILGYIGDVYQSDYFIPLGYSFSLFVLFVILPSIYFIFQSLSISSRPNQTFLSMISFFFLLVCPFVLLYHYGLYTSEHNLLSSVFISISSIREGWTQESAIYYLHPSLISELNLQLGSFYIVLILRIIFLCISIAYFVGRTTLTKACIVGLFQEIILLFLAVGINTSIPPSNYHSSGVIPIPVLFPFYLLLFLIHRKLAYTEFPDEEYIQVPLLLLIKQQFTGLMKRFSSRR
jgi:hypothetical protein